MCTEKVLLWEGGAGPAGVSGAGAGPSAVTRYVSSTHSSLFEIFFKDSPVCSAVLRLCFGSGRSSRSFIPFMHPVHPEGVYLAH